MDLQTVTLDVNGRLFHCDLGLLTKHSRFFKSYFSQPSTLSKKGDNFKIRGNPDLFEHIERYIATGVYPILFGANGEHDVPQYMQLLGEARYFGLDKLAQWLQKRTYLEAVVITHQLEWSALSGKSKTLSINFDLLRNVKGTTYGDISFETQIDTSAATYLWTLAKVQKRVYRDDFLFENREV